MITIEHRKEHAIMGMTNVYHENSDLHAAKPAGKFDQDRALRYHAVGTDTTYYRTAGNKCVQHNAALGRYEYIDPDSIHGTMAHLYLYGQNGP